MESTEEYLRQSQSGSWKQTPVGLPNCRSGLRPVTMGHLQSADNGQSSARWKKVATLGFCLVAFHIVLIIFSSFVGVSAMDLRLHDKVVEGNVHLNDHVAADDKHPLRNNLVYQRLKRHLYEETEPERALSDNKETGSSRDIENESKARDTVADRAVLVDSAQSQIPPSVEEKAVPSSENTCSTGHIQGLRPICDTFGCLQKLQVQPQYGILFQDNTDSFNRSVLFGARWRYLTSLQGQGNSFHARLLTHVTDMQWSAGIYGTVGEVGGVDGKVTNVLAFNVDHSIGERFFSTRNSGERQNSVSPTKNNPVFSEHTVDLIKDLPGLEQYLNTSASHRVTVHSGKFDSLTKREFLLSSLPQFRLLSMEGSQDFMSLLTSLEVASCVLRDGGVIIVDGVGRRGSAANDAMTHYFAKHGNSALSPLIISKNKLYLCTANWKELFLKYFLAHTNDAMDYKSKFSLKSDIKYGLKFKYLSSER